MNDIIVRVNDLNKTFNAGKGNEVPVLKGLSFEIKRGDFVSVMGPSGCGKSTLFYLISGLDKPASGYIELCGKDISKMRDGEISRFRRSDVGFIFQFYNLIPNLTVKENILLPVIMSGKKIKDYRNRLDELLETVNMREKAAAFPAELSGGQQQRVAIARALIASPQIILADEPTGNLDERSSVEVMELFQRINRGDGITIIQVTHSREMAAYGTSVLHMKDGQFIQSKQDSVPYLAQ